MQPILNIEGATRITWIGIFNDPNDLALAFVIVIPFILVSIIKERFIGKILAFTALVIIVYGIYLTNSRGGVLALLAAISSFFLLYLRKSKTMFMGFAIIIIIAFTVMKFGPSRMSQLSSEEDSSYGRIEAWYQGVEMFKNAPFFGVGYKMFTDYHYRTAHNSMVLCLADTGFFGYFILTALFYFSFTGLNKIRKIERTISGTEFIRTYSCAIQSSLIGFIAAAFFLSRTYILLPYMLIAFAAAMYNISRSNLKTNGSSITLVALRDIFGISVASLFIVYFIVKFAI